MDKVCYADYLSAFSIDKTVIWSHPSLPGTEREISLQLEIFSYQCPSRKGNSYSVFKAFPTFFFFFLKNNQPKIVLMPSRHILG